MMSEMQTDTSGNCNIAAALSRQASEQATGIAIHYPVGKRGRRVQYESASYHALNELSDVYARGLIEYGIGRGIRTALMLGPGLDFFALFFALFKAGAIPVLIDPGIGLKPLKICLSEAAPSAFIGVTRAQVARKLLGWVPGVKLVTAGLKLGWGGLNTTQLRTLGQKSSGAQLAATQADEVAAILFTSGSTGIPKGVLYRHRHFVGQVEMLRSTFDIRAGEVDLPTFPPFALFDPAMGMTTVVPLMDPTRPARADPRLLVETIERYGVTSIFGSPALLNVLSRYTEAKDFHMPTVRRIISAGAVLPVTTLRRMQKALSPGAEVYSPYGATECLPVACVSGTDLNDEITQRTSNGEGICVGSPVTPNEVKIIPITDKPVKSFADTTELPVGITGEIVVHGPTSTDTYWNRIEQTQLAKTTDSKGRVWHRMGDAGYFDAAGRLWYCGRKSQRLVNGSETLFADQIEAIFNTHPEVARTALVGVGPHGHQVPVLCVELIRHAGRKSRERIRRDLLRLGQNNVATAAITRVLFHKSFPVDIRHNAKIGREKLGLWAAGKRVVQQGSIDGMDH